jgi:hypothetical protein
MSEIPAGASEASVTPAPGPSPGASVEDDPIQLRALFGPDEANHGTMRYSVGFDNLLQVATEAVGPLTTLGGFVLATTGGDTLFVGVAQSPPRRCYRMFLCRSSIFRRCKRGHCTSRGRVRTVGPWLRPRF